MGSPSRRELGICAALAAALSLALATLSLGPGALTGASVPFAHDISGSDIWHLHYPLKAFYAQELAQGRLPLWAPDLGMGFPVLAEGQVGALYPPNLLLFWLLPLAAAFNWTLLAHLALAGAGAAMLSRQLGASRGGSVVAGVVFSGCGVLTAHLKHINIIEAAAWAPILLLLITRHLREPRLHRLGALGVACAFTLLAGHPQIAFNTLLVAGVWAAVGLSASRREGWRALSRRAAGLLMAVALGLGAAAVQWLPTLELSGLSPRQGGLSLKAATAFPLRWADLALLVRPFAFGDPGGLIPEAMIREDTGAPALHPVTGAQLMRWVGFSEPGGEPSLFWEESAYVGVFALALALAGLILGRRRRGAQGAGALAGLSLMMALGPAGGLFWLGWYGVPGFRLFRFHSRFLLYVDLGLAVLAGIGLTLLAERWAASGRGGRWLAPAAALVCAADLWLTLGAHTPVIDPSRWETPPPTAARILEEEGPGARYVPNNPGFSLFIDAWYEARGWEGDLEPYDAARLTVDPNLGLLYGLCGLTVYQQLYPLWMGHAADLLRSPAPGGAGPIDGRIAGLYGARWVLDDSGAEHPGFTEVASFDGPPRTVDGVPVDPPIPQVPRHRVRLLRGDDALPVARLAYVSRGVEEVVRAGGGRLPSAAAVADPAYSGRGEVVLSVAPGEAVPRWTPGLGEDGRCIPALDGALCGADLRDPPGPSSVRLTRPDPQSLAVRVVAPRPAWLVVEETFYPGWEATVNGEPAAIYRADVTGRAVAVPAGESEVRFEFRPRSFYWGGGISGASLLGLLLMGVGGWRRRGKLVG